MNIYLIERTDSVGYDEYESFVIAAKSEKEALSKNPSDEWFLNMKISQWASKPYLKCTLLGKAVENVNLNTQRGFITTSYRAG